MNYLKAFVLCLLIGACIAGTLEDDTLKFKEFMGKYNRAYNSENEYNSRFQAFRENVEFIERHNAKKDRTHDVAINHFADFTRAEYIEHVTQYAASSPCYDTGSKVESQAIPTNLDWRSTGNVPPVQNEGQCGSVAYINVANQVSSAVSIAVKKPPVPLSAQQMMDCYDSGNDSGCNGGDPWDLYLYIIQKGLESESSYPYSPLNDTKCEYNAKKTIASITGTGNVTTETDLKSAVYTYGPTVALFDASASEFEFYSGGIFYATDCSASQVDHVLLIVGYGVTNNTDYWIAQNVWGTEWGMNGYVNILRGKDTCGIATCSTYVTGAHAIKNV